ncbi:unnamed protein product [Amaranthus hypochondriacus]
MNHLFTLLVLLILACNPMMGHKHTGNQGQDSVLCNDVVNELSPCLSYLDNQDSSPSSSCCQGAKYVAKHYSKSKTKRQEVCQCLESLLPLVGQIDTSLVSDLPHQCGLKIKLPPISTTLNCSQIS